ncbi:MAG: hypothetical protein A4E49_01403 [Methanosaeta sp. PtaU1.Bin112]|nr:MAG: hypothetical protein A4E49_01403 [Methanosaeta sp. PtaU1.Bin112]
MVIKYQLDHQIGSAAIKGMDPPDGSSQKRVWPGGLKYSNAQQL